ncbi:MAG: hypothetical protein JOZ62_13225 [Acidobacteriaceae bacterium]|nr:hypothetical protein [Acidobacteriaceae bacterium]
MLSSAAWAFAWLSLTVPLWAKAETILIQVEGANLTSPIEITSPEALHKYTFFDGPGVSTSAGGYAPGSIIDWQSGPLAKPPAQCRHYKISAYWPARATAQCFTDRPCLVYVAFYDYDPASQRGFVYLPGKGEQWHDLDIGILYHGVEGHWFGATNSWTGFLRTLIAGRSDGSR